MPTCNHVYIDTTFRSLVFTPCSLLSDGHERCYEESLVLILGGYYNGGVGRATGVLEATMLSSLLPV